MKYLLTISVLFAAMLAFATTYYVDSAASGANNGTSWANAWTNANQISVSAGDTVYISGGTNGSSKTYVWITGQYGGKWYPSGGNPGNPVTYKIGQDSLHNGTAIFSPPSGVYEWAQMIEEGGWAYANNIVISGDANDGQNHFVLTNYPEGIGFYGPVSNIVIDHVNLGDGYITSDNGSTAVGPGIDIGFCYSRLDATNSDAFTYLTFADTGYDSNRIHNCTIYVPKLPANAYGADGIDWSGSGFSIYSNTVVGYVMTNYIGSQHADGIQPTGGGFLKVYNNSFVNMGNCGIFLDAYYGNFNDVKIYNNTVYMTETPSGGWYARGMDIIADGTGVKSFVNITVANNTLVNYPTFSSIRMGAPGAATAVWTNCILANNIGWNPGESTCYNDIAAGITQIDNVNITNLNVGLVNPTNDFHLTSAAILFIGQGTNLTSNFTTDKDGNTRPATGAWDIGAYVYAAGDTNPPAANTNRLWWWKK